MTTDVGRQSRLSSQATEPSVPLSRPIGFDPGREEWHLVCVTRKGKVSMLKNLDLRTARETYKRLLPGTYPEQHQFCEEFKHEYGGVFSWGGTTYCSSDSDRLESVEALGPEGVDLDPWHGVPPKVVFHCRAGQPYHTANGELKFRPAHPKPEPKWDARRTDFWNNPKLWEGIDPTKQMCWQRRPNEYLHNDVAGDGGAERNQLNPSDLRSDKRSQGVRPKRRTRQAPQTATGQGLTLSLTELHSERGEAA